MNRVRLSRSLGAPTDMSPLHLLGLLVPLTDGATQCNTTEPAAASWRSSLLQRLVSVFQTRVPVRPPCASSALERGLFFLHIPKAGGTSIEELGTELGVHWGAQWWYARAGVHDLTGWRNSRLHHSWRHTYHSHWRCSTPWHTPMRVESAAPRTFCIIREPASRFVSEFHQQIAQTSSYCDFDVFRTWVRKTLARLQQDGAANSTMDGCHFLGTSHYASLCDYTLRYEQLEVDLRQLLACYNVSASQGNLPRLGGGPVQQAKRKDENSSSIDECSQRFAQWIATDPQFRRLYARDLQLHDERSRASLDKCR